MGILQTSLTLQTTHMGTVEPHGAGLGVEGAHVFPTHNLTLSMISKSHMCLFSDFPFTVFVTKVLFRPF